VASTHGDLARELRGVTTVATRLHVTVGCDRDRYLELMNDTGDQALLCCEQLRVGHAGRALVPPVDLELWRGEFVAVVGRNGTGKTTWFRTLLGLLPPVSGRVVVRPGLRLSHVPQRVQLDPLFPLLACDVVAMGVDRNLSFMRPRLRVPEIVRRALERAGAIELKDRPYRALSEGQKQRVLLARVDASDPELALLDEPTSAMDGVAEREALEVIDGLRRERGTTVVVVSHYLGLIREYASRVILFDSACETVLVGPTDEVLDHAVFRRNYPGDGDDACQTH
jgi:zinc transport system ATP-binding protein